MARSLTSADRAMYKAFVSQFQHCWACRFQRLPRITAGFPLDRLENAHIVGGSGRRHDRRAIVRLCKLHHMISHGETFTECRSANVTLENLLWLKRHYDSENYDLEYIKGLRIKSHEPIEPQPLLPIGTGLV